MERDKGLGYVDSLGNFLGLRQTDAGELKIIIEIDECISEIILKPARAKVIGMWLIENFSEESML